MLFKTTTSFSEAVIHCPHVTAFTAEADQTPPWNSCDLLELPIKSNKRYMLGFAHSDRCVEAALRLRYEVFNIELGEGLSASAIHGVDRDEFDSQMTHLILLEKATGLVVGTYRLQTREDATTGYGFYSAGEYDLTPLGPLAGQLVECGRACVAIEHRSLSAVLLLWQGIAHFLRARDQRYLFGCCSLTSTNPQDGWRAMRTIRSGGFLNPTIQLRATAKCSCGPPVPDSVSSLALPKLFRAYLHLGASVISDPALDREFGTVDFLVLLDSHVVNFGAVVARS